MDAISSSASTAGSTFFLDDFRLVNQYEELWRETSAISGDINSSLVSGLIPEQSLAAFLLGKPQMRTLSWQTAASVLFKFEARLHRARLLLMTAEALEAAGQYSAADECWKRVDNEWQWLAKSPQTKRWLMAHAEQIPENDREELVDSVVAAIVDELLPILHFKAFYMFRRNDDQGNSIHVKSIENWRPIGRIYESVVKFYIAYLVSHENGKANPRSSLADCIAALLDDKKLVTDIAIDLKEQFEKWLSRWVNSWLDSKPSLYEVQSVREAIQRLESVGPPVLSLMNLLALLFVLESMKRLNPFDVENMKSSVGSLSRAFSLNPFSVDAINQLKYLEETIKQLEVQVSELPTYQRNTANLLVQEFYDVLEKVNTFSVTADGQAIEKRRITACRLQMSNALDLPFDEEMNNKAMDAIDSGLTKSAELVANPQVFAANVRELAISEFPQLGKIDWAHIEEILTENPYPSLEIIARIVKVQSLNADLPDQLNSTKTLAEVTSSGQPNNLLFKTWLFDSEFAWAKVAFLVGIVLIAHGGYLVLDKLYKISKQNSTYVEVLEAVEAGDDLGVIDKGLSFVARLQSKQSDPRKEQVITLVQEAGLREVINYVSSGENLKADQLLDHLYTIEQFRGGGK